MTEKEKNLVNNLKINMPQFTGTKAEIEKKIAMYIYIELGKTKVFDERFFLGNAKEREKIIKLTSLRRQKIDDIISNRKIVCATISNLYRTLLKDFGIKCIVKQLHEGDEHLSNIIYLSNGEEIIADVQADLPNIQTKSKTKNFGENYNSRVVMKEQISDEELFELHKACGYVNSPEDYMDNNIQKLAEKVKGQTPNNVLEAIISDEDLKKYQDDIGYIELYKYYKSIVGKVAPRCNGQTINYFNCYIKKEKEDGSIEKDYTMCIYSLYKDEINAYLYSKKQKSFIKTDLERFIELEKKGVYLGKNPNESGLKPFRKYLNRYNMECIKSRNTEQNQKEEMQK